MAVSLPADPSTARIAAMCAGLTNYERDRPDRVRFDLAAMQRLLARPGAPDLPRRLVQVGGSKGKGTTTRYLAAFARSVCAHVGTYTSPHAESVLERIGIDGAPIDESTLVAELGAVLDHVRQTADTVSFYEAMTAAALGCFRRAGVEFGVLEVGLGGRLDATTAVPVDASVLTTVELEHTELLGDSIAAIAGEKVHIFRPGKPAITGVDGIALEIAERRARDVDAPLAVFGRDFGIGEVCWRDETRGGPAQLVVPMWARDGAHAEVRVRGGAPRYEARAVALAWACQRALDRDFVPPAEIDRPHGPCCFEVDATASFVFDGAHTPESAKLLAESLDERFGVVRPRELLFGAAHGKRWAAMLEHLLRSGRVERVLLTALAGTVSTDPNEIAAWLDARSVRYEIVDDAAAGVARLSRAAASTVCVVTGSFYLAGDARRALRLAT